MKLVSRLYDSRIKSENLLIEMSIGDYLAFARKIIENNEFQRKRVRSSQTVYSVLKSDLKRGCLIPPLVLALTKDTREVGNSNNEVRRFVESFKDSLVILDGLQRTHTMLDVLEELSEAGDEETLERFLGQLIRVEIYTGINRLGILYRMLTLNTGQTPMSLRQQIEILYLDYASTPIADVQLIREVDSTTAKGPNQLNFKEVIEGFNSYVERNELPIGRGDILENIRSLESLATENSSEELFEHFVTAFHKFLTKTIALVGEDCSLGEEFENEFGAPFGKNVLRVFKRPQSLAGFGAAVGKLKDFDIVSGFEEIIDQADSLSLSVGGEDFLIQLNRNLLWIKSNTKKIGNSQRMYFQYYFRDLFNSEGDSFLDLYESIDKSFMKFKSQVL